MPRRRMRQSQDQSSKKKNRDGKQANLPAPGWEEVTSSPSTFVAGVGPPAPKFVSSSSIGVGSVVDALTGDAPRGSVVEGVGPQWLLVPPFFSYKSGNVSVKDSHPKVHQ